jgi:serine/threonine protein kinase
MMNLSARTLIDERYEILSVIGAGGIGAVYRARQVALNRDVALKFLNTTLPGSEQHERLWREAKALSAIQHEHIVSFYGCGIWNLTPYLVLELVDGISLEQVLSSGQPLPLGYVLALARQACQALSYAHKAGVVHRDLKPVNMMVLSEDVDKEPVLKIVDFGMAKLLPEFGHAVQKLTQTGTTVGSVLYMSPEQCFGKTSLDSRADIYSLGAVLFYCLTGRPAFQRDDPLLIMMAHVNEPAPELAVLHASVEPFREAWQRLIDNCLAKDPADRYSSADELRNDIELLAAGKSITTGANSGFALSRKKLPAKKERTFKPRSAVLLAVVAFLTVTVCTTLLTLKPARVQQNAHDRFVKFVADRRKKISNEERATELAQILEQNLRERDPGVSARDVEFIAKQMVVIGDDCSAHLRDIPPSSLLVIRNCMESVIDAALAQGDVQNSDTRGNLIALEMRLDSALADSSCIPKRLRQIKQMGNQRLIQGSASSLADASRLVVCELSDKISPSTAEAKLDEWRKEGTVRLTGTLEKRFWATMYLELADAARTRDPSVAMRALLLAKRELSGILQQTSVEKQRLFSCSVRMASILLTNNKLHESDECIAAAESQLTAFRATPLDYISVADYCRNRASRNRAGFWQAKARHQVVLASQALTGCAEATDFDKREKSKASLTVGLTASTVGESALCQRLCLTAIELLTHLEVQKGSDLIKIAQINTSLAEVCFAHGAADLGHAAASRALSILDRVCLKSGAEKELLAAAYDQLQSVTQNAPGGRPIAVPAYKKAMFFDLQSPTPSSDQEKRTLCARINRCAQLARICGDLEQSVRGNRRVIELLGSIKKGTAQDNVRLSWAYLMVALCEQQLNELPQSGIDTDRAWAAISKPIENRADTLAARVGFYCVFFNLRREHGQQNASEDVLRALLQELDTFDARNASSALALGEAYNAIAQELYSWEDPRSITVLQTALKRLSQSSDDGVQLRVMRARLMATLGQHLRERMRFAEADSVSSQAAKYLHTVSTEDLSEPTRDIFVQGSQCAVLCQLAVKFDPTVAEQLLVDLERESKYCSSAQSALVAGNADLQLVNVYAWRAYIAHLKMRGAEEVNYRSLAGEVLAKAYGRILGSDRAPTRTAADRDVVARCALLVASVNAKPSFINAIWLSCLDHASFIDEPKTTPDDASLRRTRLFCSAAHIAPFCPRPPAILARFEKIGASVLPTRPKSALDLICACDHFGITALLNKQELLAKLFDKQADSISLRFPLSDYSLVSRASSFLELGERIEDKHPQIAKQCFKKAAQCLAKLQNPPARVSLYRAVCECKAGDVEAARCTYLLCNQAARKDNDKDFLNYSGAFFQSHTGRSIDWLTSNGQQVRK